MEEMIEKFDKILEEEGYPVTFKDICRMFYDQGYMDTFLDDDEDFNKYFEGVFWISGGK